MQSLNEHVIYTENITMVVSCGLFHDDVSISAYAAWNNKIIMNDELGRIWKGLWPEV
jgi:hypothetical protein